MFDEVTHMPFLNYQSARILGFALNALGFETWHGQRPSERALQTALLAWTKRNFLKRWNENPEVAASGFPANLSFDAKNRRLVKVYVKGLAREAPKSYFGVDE